MKAFLCLAAFTLLLSGCYKSWLTEEPALEKTYWKLIELNGRKVDNPGQFQTEVFLRLYKDLGDGLGNNGCNYLFGIYAIKSLNRIDIMITGQTLAFCRGLDIQTEFGESINAAFTYTLKNRVLELRDSTGIRSSKYLSVP